MDHLGSSKCPIDDNKFASVNPVQLENRLQRIHADADWKTFHRFLLGSRLRSQTIAPLGEEPSTPAHRGGSATHISNVNIVGTQYPKTKTTALAIQIRP
jgi:hypothetical protein